MLIPKCLLASMSYILQEQIVTYAERLQRHKRIMCCRPKWAVKVRFCRKSAFKCSINMRVC
jgi:hypothetical protein